MAEEIEIRPFVTLTLDKQQIECMQAHCFPYMEMLCKTNIKNSEHDELLNLNDVAIDSLYSDVVAMIFIVSKQRKKTVEVQLMQGTAIAFYKLLRQVPHAANFPYLNNLVEHITLSIENQIWPN